MMKECAMLPDLNRHIASRKACSAKNQQNGVSLETHPHGNCMVLRNVRHGDEGPHKCISSSHQLQVTRCMSLVPGLQLQLHLLKARYALRCGSVNTCMARGSSISARL